MYWRNQGSQCGNCARLSRGAARENHLFAPSFSGHQRSWVRHSNAVSNGDCCVGLGPVCALLFVWKRQNAILAGGIAGSSASVGWFAYHDSAILLIASALTAGSFLKSMPS